MVQAISVQSSWLQQQMNFLLPRFRFKVTHVLQPVQRLLLACPCKPMGGRTAHTAVHNTRIATCTTDHAATLHALQGRVLSKTQEAAY
jgi:hypothetical protein